jgi:uncharacterized protein YcfJ
MQGSLRSQLAFALLAGTISCLVQPARADTFSQSAPVISATPIYERTGTAHMNCVQGTQADDEDDAPSPGAVERCKLIPDQPLEIVGYEVRYRFDGREHVTRLPYDPGNEVRVQVDVEPEVR